VPYSEGLASSAFIPGLFRIGFEPGEEVSARLEAMDRDPAKIDLVINSHFHFDHVGGNALIPNATMLVQRREWMPAWTPTPPPGAASTRAISILAIICAIQGVTNMEIGAAIFFSGYSIAPTQLEVALEEPGFDSLRVAEHSHIPVTRRFNVPGGGELTRQYYDVMDPFVTLSAAAVTTRHANVRICAGFRTPAVTSLLRARAAGA
jgi:ribonuclease BN (tRNA processing enzyme)